MESQCNQHPLMCQDVRETKDNTQKIIVGLYGPLDNSSKGFIHKVEEELTTIKSSIINRSTIIKAVLALAATIITAAASVIAAMASR